MAKKISSEPGSEIFLKVVEGQYRGRDEQWTCLNQRASEITPTPQDLQIFLWELGEGSFLYIPLSLPALP